MGKLKSFAGHLRVDAESPGTQPRAEAHVLSHSELGKKRCPVADALLERTQKAAEWKKAEFQRVGGIEQPKYTAVVRNKRTNQYYYGFTGEKDLLRENTEKQLNMPVKKMEVWDPGHCAEPKAINDALKDGSRKEDLVLLVVRTETGEPGKPCRSCQEMLRGMSVHAASAQKNRKKRVRPLSG